MSRIAVIVLAAGTSERFGVLDKLAASIAGRSLLAWTIDASADARVAARDRIVVIGPGSAVVTRIAEAHAWRTTFAHDAPRGMGASLRAGLAAAGDEVSGAIVLLGDDPLAACMLSRVLDAATIAPEAMVAVRRSPFLPHPVYLPRANWPAPDAPVADHGLQESLDASDPTWLDDAGPHPVDVDTQDDLTRLRAAMSVDVRRLTAARSSVDPEIL